MPIAIPAVPSHTIGPRDMSMHTGYMLHGASKKSEQRTLNPVVQMSMRKPCAERSHQPPWSGRMSGESTNSCRSRL